MFGPADAVAVAAAAAADAPACPCACNFDPKKRVESGAWGGAWWRRVVGQSRASMGEQPCSVIPWSRERRRARALSSESYSLGTAIRPFAEPAVEKHSACTID